MIAALFFITALALLILTIGKASAIYSQSKKVKNEDSNKDRNN